MSSPPPAADEATTATVQRLLRVSEALARAASPEAVLQVALAQGLEALGAHAGLVVLKGEGEQLEVCARRALSPPLAAGLLALEGPLPLSSLRPVCAAARTGQPVWMTHEAYRACAGLPACHPTDSACGLPLESEGEVLGALGLWVPAEVGESPALRALAQLLAQLCGQALRRARLQEAEQAARLVAAREHARATLLADALPHHVWTADAQGRVEAVNAWTLRFAGLTSQEALRECLGRLLHPEDLPVVVGVAHPARARGEPYEVEARLRRASDGEWRWHLIRASPVKDEAGTPHTWVGAAVDIHQSKVLEEERAALLLRESQARRELEEQRTWLASLYRVLPTPLFVTEGPEHRLVLVSDTLQQLLAGEVLGRTVPEALSTPREAMRLLDRVYASGERLSGKDFALRYTSPEGMEGLAWFDFAVQPLRDVSGKVMGLLVVGVDVTDKVLGRERLEAARRAAEEANQLKDEFIARVSHELATPLFAMRMWLELLRGPAPQRRKVALEALAQCVRAQGKLVEDLLDVSRAVTGKLRLQRQSVLLEEVVERAVGLAWPQAQARSVILGVHVRARGLRVEGDAARLEQVVGNLLSNALKFTPSGGRVQVELAQAEAGWVRLSVEDTGRGMAADFLPHLFSPFRQEAGAGTRQQGGLGLGLSITRSLVEAHGGLISAHSAGPGRGATFLVTLPQAAPADAPLPTPLPVDGRTAPLLEGVQLLLVEDDALGRAALAQVLRQQGARVEAVASVRQALGALARRRPDALVSDLTLPGEDGLTLVRQVRAQPELGGRALPALALSARTRAEDRARALEAGFDAHLGKPAEPEVLVALLRQLLERRSAQLA